MARKKVEQRRRKKVLLDLIDELIAELDVTCTDANILTKSEAKSAISVLFGK